MKKVIKEITDIKYALELLASIHNNSTHEKFVRLIVEEEE